MTDGQHSEWGGAAVGGAGYGEVYVGANIWGMRHLGRWDLGGAAFRFGWGTAVPTGIGAFSRWRALETDRFVLAPQVSFGLVWASVALPAALKVAPSVWLYTAPFVGGKRAFGVPLGASFTLKEHLRLNVEGGLEQLVYMDSPIGYGSIGLSYRP